MSEQIPAQLVEAQRKIRSSQVELAPTDKPVETLDAALERLNKATSSFKPIPNAQYDAEQHRSTVEKLRGVWNAPARHASRTELDTSATEWMAMFGRLGKLLGTGFTAALVGLRGPGKTQLGIELMRNCTERHRSAYYCTAMDYFMRIKDAFHNDRKETQAEAQKFFAKFSLLVLDEVNVRSDSAWEDNMLADLIGKRYNALLDTVLISNETAEQFEKSMGPSIIDRLNETGGIAECTWRSFRQ